MFNPRQPLWLPAGSIRAILALIVVIPLVVIALTSGATLTGDQIIGVASLVLTAYFVQKSATSGK